MTDLGTVIAAGVTYTVRRADADDVPALVALLAADAIAASRGDSGSTSADLEPYRQAFARIDADPHQLLICLDDPDEVVIGTLQMTLIPGLSRRGTTRAQIESVRVAEQARGRGIGGALIRWAIDRARQDGAGTVQLTTDARRHDAHRFYRALGFEASHWGFKLAIEDSTRVDGGQIEGGSASTSDETAVT